MIPKTPNSYRVPEPIRSEIKALMSDLDLVFVRKSFVPIPNFGDKGVFVPAYRLKVESQVVLTSSRPRRFLDNEPIKSDSRCRDFMKRNHHYKNFKNVYPSDNNYSQGSFSWD